MKIIVTANKVPFMPGGADYHIRGLAGALEAHGHEVELLQIPFRFSPEDEVERSMQFCEAMNLNRPNGVAVDKVISVQFPTYGVQHDDHRVWIMHQHRAVYELFDQQPTSSSLASLRESVKSFDQRCLSGASHLFANSRRVAERLHHYNGLLAQPLYHPPHSAAAFYSDEPLGYFFCPSRLETLKRQSLVIEAASLTATPLRILIGGEGGQKQHYQKLINDYGVAEKVKLTGRFSEAEKLVLYARCLGVLFVPQDEDYGYITLEAMLSSKPVITCNDSGGPLEFVAHEDNGLVVEPSAAALAAAMDRLFSRQQLARALGRRARESILEKDISWSNIVKRLLA